MVARPDRAAEIQRRLLLLLIINVLLLIVGCFMETIAAISILVPILMPIVTQVGIDPVQFGVVMVLNLMIGLLTPPMGLALFLVAEIAKVKMKEVLREMLPYYIPLTITLLLITYVPEITTWIPRLALAP